MFGYEELANIRAVNEDKRNNAFSLASFSFYLVSYVLHSTAKEKS